MDPVTVDLRTDPDQRASSLALNARGREEASEGKPFSIQDPLDVVAHPAFDISAKRTLLAS